MKLSDTLTAMFNGGNFSAMALYEAMHHEVTTFNDRLVLTKFSHCGIMSESEMQKLRELANYIREYGD